MLRMEAENASAMIFIVSFSLSGFRRHCCSEDSDDMNNLSVYLQTYSGCVYETECKIQWGVGVFI